MLTPRARALIIALGWSCAGAAAVGCQASPYDIARRDDEALRSRADTLLFLLSVAEPVSPPNPDATQAAPSKVSHERVWIDAKRIVDVTLEIDGTPLGKFAAVRGQAVSPRAGVVTAERDSALIRADFGDLYDATTLKTVGDWVKALGKTVGTGMHVLTLVGLTLESDSGVRVAYPARAFLPFSVEDGASTAFAGHAELVLPGERR